MQIPQDKFSTGWIIYRVSGLNKNNKAAINPKNKDDRGFQYAASIALNFDEIKKDLQRVSNTKPFINKYNRDVIRYPSKIDDRKKFEKNNPTIPLNVFILKKRKYAQLMSQKFIRTVKNK